MKILLSFAGKPGTRQKPTVVELEAITDLTLDQMKVLWEAEQLINSATLTRVHVGITNIGIQKEK